MGAQRTGPQLPGRKRPAGRDGGRGLRMLLVAGLALVWTQGAIAADPNKGREIYMNHCQNCHGVNGAGQFPGMPDFSRGEALFKPDVELVRTIGAGQGMMPAFRALFTEEELLDVVAFLRTLR